MTRLHEFTRYAQTETVIIDLDRVIAVSPYREGKGDAHQSIGLWVSDKEFIDVDMSVQEFRKLRDGNQKLKTRNDGRAVHGEYAIVNRR